MIPTPVRSTVSRRRLTWSMLTLLLAAGCSGPSGIDDDDVEPDPTEPEYWVIGYHPWWLEGAWSGYDLAVVNKIMFFDLSVGEDGSITERNGWPGNWTPLVRRVHDNGGMVIPTVSLFDTQTFSTLFEERSNASSLVLNLMRLVAEADIDGLHIDFEVFDPVSEDARSGFFKFVKDLRAEMELRERKLYLSMFALALDPGNNFNEGALSSYVDYFVVQGYDLHWSGDDTAGPVSALEGWSNRNWKSVLKGYLDQGVPRSKIVMGVPYYGYEWPTASDQPGSRTRGTATFTTYAPLPTPNPPPSARERALQFGLRRDEVSGSPYYVYEDSTGWHQGWFEDTESLRAKYDFVKSERLGGVAIFPLGYGDESLSEVLRQIFPTVTVATRIE